MKSDFLIALTQLAAERNLPREIVLSAIEAALASAYKKDNIAAGQNVSVKLDPGTGDVTAHIVKTVVEEVEDPLLEVSLEDAQNIQSDAEVGGTVATEKLAHNTGRIAAQTAKQVVLQRLREAEREIVFEEYADKEGDVFAVNVQRVEPKQVIVELGRAEAILPISEQVPGERYRTGHKMKVLLQAIERSAKGPELIVSRADQKLLRRLFEMEVPEIYNGAVEIVAIAREAGSRSKVAVRATQSGVDPVGSCVGLRGVRIQNIVNELQGEKIDVVEWSKDPGKFIASALSPSQVMRVELDPDSENAVAVVPDRQLSLAIGKEGQNARLAAKLTGWSVDIRSNVEADAKAEVLRAEAAEAAALQPAEVVEEPVAPIVEIAEAVVAQVPISPSVAEEQPVEVAPEPAEVIAEESEVVAAPAVQDEPVVSVPIPESIEPVVVAPDPLPVVQIEADPVQLDAIEEVIPEPVAAQVDVPTAPPAPAPVPEPVPAPAAVDRSGSIRDVSADVWSIRRAAPPEPGQIRFAEDIAGLRGGVTARRTRRTARTEEPASRRRKPKGGRKRR